MPTDKRPESQIVHTYSKPLSDNVPHTSVPALTPDDCVYPGDLPVPDLAMPQGGIDSPFGK